jgi:hypothetical protein
MKWHSFFRVREAKRLVGLESASGCYLPRLFPRVPECGSLYEVEDNIGLMVQLKERLETPQYLSLMELHRGQSSTKCASVSTTSQEQK